VEDRTQVAELDPSIFLEIPDDEDEEQPCQACGEDDNEDVLMYCDGCQKLWHTYCVGLQEVPYGTWFCDNCRAQREVDPRQVGSARSARSSRRRTRGQQRRQRTHVAAHDSSWNQVWQSVWTRINIDLDFPYDEDETSATYYRRHRQQNHANRQAHDAWLRRMQVAELHGAGGRFRESEPALLGNGQLQSVPTSRRQRSSPAAEVQTADEMMAWHAFEQARASPVAEASSRKKKRKSRTTTPTEADEEQSAVTVKRRRITPLRSSPAPSTSASTGRRRPSSHQQSPIIPRPPVLPETAVPSFLQSLLQEVEDSSSTSYHVPLHRASPRVVTSPPAEQHSPRPSSPALSPLPSNHSSPRAMSATPPPGLQAGSLRPSSPTGLSSSIQPVFPLTEYSPLRTKSPEPAPDHVAQPSISRPCGTRSHSATTIAEPAPKRRAPRILDAASSPLPEARHNDASPARTTMSLSAKADVQKLVSAALKPHYNDQTINKDEYTVINRDISRMLYDRIGDFGALDMDDKVRWEKVAGEEVSKAVGALKAQT